MTSIQFDSRRFLILLLAFFAVNLIFTKLELGSLPSYDDGYYAQKAREMLSRGDLWTATVGAKPTFDNPPGFFWTMMVSYKMFGENEFGARFSSALAGVIGIIGTFLLFELLFSTRIGFLAGLILTLTSLYLKYSRHSMMDVTVAAACVWCFYFFVKGVNGRPWNFLWTGVIGAYVPFAKSAFGVMVLGTLFFYLLWIRKWRVFGQWQLWVGLLLFFLPYGYWCFHEYGLYQDRFLREHFFDLLYSASRSGGVNDFWYDYLLVLLKYFPFYLPLMMYGLWQAVKAKGADRQAHGLAMIYFLVFLFVLSAQKTTKTWYFISALPACAGLAAVGADRLLRRFSLNQIGRTVAFMALATFFIVHLTPVNLSSSRAVELRRLAPYVRAVGDQGFIIYSYKIDNYGLNSSLLFYSDRSAPTINEEGLKTQLRQDAKVAVIFMTDEWERLKASFPQLTVVRRTPLMLLVTNSPVAQEEVY